MGLGWLPFASGVLGGRSECCMCGSQPRARCTFAGVWSGGADGESRSGGAGGCACTAASLQRCAGRHWRRAESIRQPVHIQWPSEAHTGGSSLFRSLLASVFGCAISNSPCNQVCIGQHRRSRIHSYEGLYQHSEHLCGGIVNANRILMLFCTTCIHWRRIRIYHIMGTDGGHRPHICS